MRLAAFDFSPRCSYFHTVSLCLPPRCSPPLMCCRRAASRSALASVGCRRRLRSLAALHSRSELKHQKSAFRRSENCGRPRSRFNKDGCLMTLDGDSHPPRVTSAACKMTLSGTTRYRRSCRTTERTKDRKAPISAEGPTLKDESWRLGARQLPCRTAIRGLPSGTCLPRRGASSSPIRRCRLRGACGITPQPY
jgi:hypothetical protein